MATIAIPRPIPPHRSASDFNTPITPPLSLEHHGPAERRAPIPNKHIPVCPPGPAQPDTPPQSPKTPDDYCQKSILYPPHGFRRRESGNSTLYEIDAANIADALDFSSRQPLPDPANVFPWLHGLHPKNQLQQAFFNARSRTQRNPPTCLRGITIVKADGDLSRSRIKGAIAPNEILNATSPPRFIEADPREGFSVRNFHIQPAKVALMSDIIVYGDEREQVRKVAWNIAAAQLKWREIQEEHGVDAVEFNTFICTSPFSEFEDEHQDIISIDSHSDSTGKVVDFVYQERVEMRQLTETSEISHNVFMGPTPDLGSNEEADFDILIECIDGGCLNPEALQFVAENLSEKVTRPFHEFPSSGSILPPTYSHDEADGILDTCKWIYHLAHGTRPLSKRHAVDSEGDSFIEDDDHDVWETEEEEAPYPPRRILIHCADGYTESSMLGVAYYSFSTGKPIPEAWMDLHTSKGRNFFAYPSDVALLTTIALRLLQESPLCRGKGLLEITSMVQNEPSWLAGLNGSFPSRILDYLYLGDLNHANNPDLLRAIGIHQVLSVGETTTWLEGELEEWGEDNVCKVQGVQDNGIDPLTDEFTRCLDFIGMLFASPNCCFEPH